MKKLDFKIMNKIIIASFFTSIFFIGCERSVDGLDEPGLTENPEVFIDGFSSGLDYFPFADSKVDAFSVDEEVTFDGNGASMRFDIPNVGDRDGAYSGAIFRDENGGRDLTEYDALTFYAKATTAGTIDNIGFGQDFLGNEFQATVTNLQLSTFWKKYVIPIPDASRLTAERGMFWYSEGPEDGKGYTFWVDELKFERLGTIAQPRPAIFGGDNQSQVTYIGVGGTIAGLTQTFNLAEGGDVTVTAAPAYFDFSSSDPSVATVADNGQISVVGEGTSVITASLNGVDASGSLTLESRGEFDFAPTPTEDPGNVISIFSDAYTNVPVDFYNGFYQPFQTTTSNDFAVNGDNLLGYENFNFVGIEFNQNVPTIDATNMTKLKVSVYFPNDIPANSAFSVNLVDFGEDGVFGSDDIKATATIRPNTTPALVARQWITIELDIQSMTSRDILGQIVFDADQGPALRGASLFVDNIYLTNE